MLPDNATNYTLFRDCFSSALLQRVSLASPPKTRKRSKKDRKIIATESEASKQPSKTYLDAGDQALDSPETLAQDLADFTEVEPEFLTISGPVDRSQFLALEVFESLPKELQTISYSQIQSDKKISARWIESPVSDLLQAITPVIPPTVSESLDAYSLLAPGTSFGSLLADTLSSYLDSISAPPPVWSTTRKSECEICARDWIPLTYHHLIPKEAHEKAIKRGWHEEWVLNSVAWLCRACHSFVHRSASNEELAKDYFTVERLLEREDVQSWAQWVGKIRWKAT